MKNNEISPEGVTFSSSSHVHCCSHYSCFFQMFLLHVWINALLLPSMQSPAPAQTAVLGGRNLLHFPLCCKQPFSFGQICCFAFDPSCV